MTSNTSTISKVAKKIKKPPVASKLSYSKAWFKKGETGYGSQGDLSNTPYNLLLTDASEENLIQLVDHHDRLGRAQVGEKKETIQKLRDLAEGVINISDFIKEDELKQLQLLDPSINFREDDIDLEFFPLAPPILHRLTGEFDKKYLKFNINVVNPEATNEIIEKRNTDLLGIFQEMYEKSVSQGQPMTDEFRQKVQEKMKSYSKDYRTEIEEWCTFFMDKVTEQFNFRNLERSLFKESIIHEEPFIHINYQGDSFYPEKWLPEDTFYIKSKAVTDASDYTMIGHYSYIDLTTVLNKYSLDEDQVKTLSKWTEYYNASGGFVQNGSSFFEGSNKRIQESSQNYITGWNILNNQSNQQDGYVGQNRLVRETYMYFLVPKKVGILTTITDSGLYTVEVNDTFKVTIKPEYSHKEKTKENLTKGEHVEWTYINVLYRCLKLDMTFGNSFYNNKNDEFEPIYIYLGKHDIQYKHKNLRYGVRIPVHGGSITGWSVTGKIAPWQKFYNYIWNRIKQLYSTEIGKFLIINQNILPHNTMDGSFDEHKLLKAMLIARDNNVLPTDLSLTNTGQLQAGGGFGQVVDLTKDQEIAQKAQLASLIKQECYDSLGLNPTFLANISPYQSAKSVAMGNDQTITQLQYLYTRHYEIMKEAWSTILETGLYLTSKGELKNFSYTNSDGQRIIFNLKDENPLLAELNLYPESDPSALLDLETIKSFALSNNTAGLDIVGASDIIFSKSPIEVRSLLKEGVMKKEKQEQMQRQHEQEMQDKQLKAQNDMVEKQMQNDNMNKEADRQERLEYANIESLRNAKGDALQLSNEIKDMSQYNLQVANLNHQKSALDMKSKIDQMKLDNAQQTNQNQVDVNRDIKLKELDLRQKELDQTQKRNMIMAANEKTKIENERQKHLNKPTK